MEADNDSLLSYFLCTAVPHICTFVSVPSLLSPRTELPRPKATGWTEFQVCENNYSAQPLEQPGGTYTPWVTWTMCTLVCLPLCATQTLPFSMCAKTTERLGSTVESTMFVSSISLSSASSSPVLVKMSRRGRSCMTPRYRKGNLDGRVLVGGTEQLLWRNLLDEE